MKIAPLLAIVALASGAASAADSVVIHEWGTFTSLQDEQGKAIGGINTDDEPVPKFVHNIAGQLLIPPSQVPHTFYQGAPACHPDVTLRLETPVLYVHAPASFTDALKVHVAFHGGWLTQYYPTAKAEATGVRPKLAQWNEFGKITSDTVSTLTWPKVKIEPIDSKITGPATEDPVWLAPGKVDARMLTAEGESERFLFYRGVGHLDAPLKVVQGDAGALTIDWQAPPLREGESLRKLWLLDVRPGGEAAFRLYTVIGDARAFLPLKANATFKPEDYSKEGSQKLRADLRAALIADGLYADEADALLNTWELSYFKSSGLRLFFLVPRSWTERHLPLSVSLPDGSPVSDIARAMVGRIELVSPEQRALLRIIAKGPVPDPWKDIREKVEQATLKKGDQDSWMNLISGKLSFEDLGIDLPPVFRAYVELGRFRDALILDELKRSPTPELEEFAKTYMIEAYKVR